MSNIDEKLKFLNERKQAEKHEEFENAYKEYKKLVKTFSGGLVKTNRAEFIKMYSFYSTLTYPSIAEPWEAYLGKKL